VIPLRQAALAPLVRRAVGAAAVPWYLEGGVSAVNCLAAYLAKGVADIATSYINLASPGTNDATAPVAAPTFSASTGWTFNGSTQYLLAGAIVGTNSQSVVIRFSNGGPQIIGMCGVSENTKVQNHIYPYYTNNNAYFRAGGSYNTSGVNYTSGVLAATPAKGYANGSPLGNVAGAWSGTTTYVYEIGGTNFDGSITLWAGKIQAIAIYDVTLSDAQVLAISTAMAAL
jgi:hypothetical protein